MRTLQLKLILLFRSVPHDDIKLRELLNKVGLIERFTPYLGGAPGSRGPVRSEEAREWLEKRRNEAIARDMAEQKRLRFGTRRRRRIARNDTGGGLGGLHWAPSHIQKWVGTAESPLIF